MSPVVGVLGGRARGARPPARPAPRAPHPEGCRPRKRWVRRTAPARGGSAAAGRGRPRRAARARRGGRARRRAGVAGRAASAAGTVVGLADHGALPVGPAGRRAGGAPPGHPAARRRARRRPRRGAGGAGAAGARATTGLLDRAAGDPREPARAVDAAGRPRRRRSPRCPRAWPTTGWSPWSARPGWARPASPTEVARRCGCRGRRAGSCAWRASGPRRSCRRPSRTPCPARDAAAPDAACAAPTCCSSSTTASTWPRRSPPSSRGCSARASRVRILATSQRRSGSTARCVCAARPAARGRRRRAVRERAAERAPSFRLTADTAPAVAQLCRAPRRPAAGDRARRGPRPDRCPWPRSRSASTIGSPCSPTRSRRRPPHARAALSWSYDLLFPDDQRGLWALAQFPGGATMPAVEHVLAALDVPAASALDIVARLVDRSLVSVDDGGAGATRYRLLDSVRAYAADRAVAAGAADLAADALLGWVAGMAGAVAARVRGPDQAEHVARTAAERATIDAALDRARGHDPVTGLRIAVDLGWAWVLLDDSAAAGRLRGARLAAGAAPAGLRVAALLLESWLEAMSGDLRPARTAMDAAIELAGDDPELLNLTRWYRGFRAVPGEAGPPSALSELDRCHAAYAAGGDTWRAGGARLLAAFAHLALGDLAAGRAACEDAIRAHHPAGRRLGAAARRGRARPGRAGRAPLRRRRAPPRARRRVRGAAGVRRRGRAAPGTPRPGPARRRRPDRGGHPEPRDRRRGAGGDLRLLAMTRVTLAELRRAAGDRTPPASCSWRPTAGTPRPGRARAPSPPRSYSSLWRRVRLAEPGIPSTVHRAPASCCWRPTSSRRPHRSTIRSPSMRKTWIPRRVIVRPVRAHPSGRRCGCRWAVNRSTTRSPSAMS